MKCILALDQGTTSSRSILFDHDGTVMGSAQQEFRQIYPQPGWVEHDPEEIWTTQQRTGKQAMHQAGVSGKEIAAIGITNQRETTVLWNRKTGRPVHNAMVWQDRRTTGLCRHLKQDGLEPLFRERTGLRLDPYFAGTKIKWLLDHVDNARVQAERGELAFGTIDSWLLWNLTNGRRHATDISNASRTLLFNIHTLEWDDDLMAILNIPRSILPDVYPSSGFCEEVDPHLFAPGCRITGMAGDQQAALFGQACFEPGAAKNTYGTGCFLLMNTGAAPAESENNLLSTIAWQLGDIISYALEGSIFAGGAIVQWLRDELGIIGSTSEIETLAGQVSDTGGVYFVPAFTGLGAPHWDPQARGIIAGLTRGTNKAHLARAALEAMCFQSVEVLQSMEKDYGQALQSLRVDGGASANNLLMQLQADLLQVPVLRPQQIETTAFGAAALAGLGAEFWKNTDGIKAKHSIEHVFEPRISGAEAQERLVHWMDAVERSKSWEEA